MGSSTSRRSKTRERRAAAQRLTPIRGQAGRRLQHSGLRSGRVVGLSQFAQGMTGRQRSRSGSRLRGWVLAAVPVVVGLVWVVARATRHL